MKLIVSACSAVNGQWKNKPNPSQGPPDRSTPNGGFRIKCGMTGPGEQIQGEMRKTNPICGLPPGSLRNGLFGILME
jgi:hypothetical protein